MTHVIILAQGQQKRLPDVKIPKQMLPLAACDDEPIINRTLCQLAMLAPSMPHDESCEPGCDGTEHYVDYHATVVCADPLEYHVEASGKSGVWQSTRKRMSIDAYELGDPGNSSLKGIAHYLDEQGYLDTVNPTTEAQIVVLLGDVVYSWECLRACLRPTHWNMGFVGTSDLSRSGGELWGLTWTGSAHDTMMTTLAQAIQRHPPFEAYQPGQLRRWLWETDTFIDGHSVPRRTWYTAIDDYTRDIDLPEHVAQLDALSSKAATDDAANGLLWGAR